MPLPVPAPPQSMPDQHRDGYAVTTDRARFDVAAVHRYLTRSYWSPGIPFEFVAACVERSLGFGLLHGAEQVGFARVISDYTAMAHLADVYVLEEHRGRGLGKWLVGCVMAHPALQNLRRWTLSTADAHELYASFGFTRLAKPEVTMERVDPEAYLR